MIQSLRHRVLFGIVIIELVMLGLMYVAERNHIVEGLQQEASRRLEDHFQLNRKLLLQGLIAEDYSSLESVVLNLTRLRGVEGASVRAPDERILASATGTSNSKALSFTNIVSSPPAPVRFRIEAGGATFGFLDISLTRDYFDEVLQRARVETLAIAGVGTIATGVFLYLFIFLSLRILDRLRDAANRLGAGEPGVQVGDVDSLEFRPFVSAFNAMSTRVHELLKLREEDLRSLREMIHAFPGMGVILGADGSIEFVNDRALGVFGAELETLQSGSLGIVDFLYPDDREMFLRALDDLMERAQDTEINARFQQHGIADPVWFRCRLRRFLDSDGKPLKYFVVGDDITDRMVGGVLGVVAGRDDRVAQAVGDAILTIDRDGNILYANSASEDVFGDLAGSLSRQSIHRLLPGVFRSGADGVTVRERFAHGSAMETLGRRDGTVLFPALVHVQEIPDGSQARFLVVTSDLTEERRLEHVSAANQQRLELILNSSEQAILVFDISGRIEMFNTVSCRLFGHPSTMLEGMNVGDLIPLPPGYSSYSVFLRFLAKVGSFECLGLSRGGAPLQLRIRCRSHMIEGRQTFILFADLADSDWYAVGDQQVSFRRDGITGLHNRAYFREQLESFLERPQESFSPTNAVMFVSVDQFDALRSENPTSDMTSILRSVATHLVTAVPRGHVSARIRDGEFAMLLFAMPVLKAYQLADRIRRSVLETPVRHGGRNIDLRCTISVLPYPFKKLSPDEALSLLRTRALAAQLAGGNAVVPADRPGGDNDVGELVMAKGGPDVADPENYRLQYLPVVRTAGEGRAEFCEALFRIAGGGTLLNGDVIFSAELSDARRVQIDCWVVDRVLNDMGLAHANGVGPRVSVKLSEASLYSASALEFIQRRVRHFAGPSGRLLLSIPISLVTSDYPYVRTVCQAFREAGCGIVVEGYRPDVVSSAYLHDLPIDYLKLHPLLSVTEADERKALVMQSAVAVATSIKAEVIATYVEDPTAFAFYRENRIELMQGFHIHPFCDTLEISQPAHAVESSKPDNRSDTPVDG